MSSTLFRSASVLMLFASLILVFDWNATPACHGFMMLSAEALQNNAALEASLQKPARRHTRELPSTIVGEPEESQIHMQTHTRTKRGAIWDFFQKIVVTKNLVVDQFVDTKNTLNEVYNLANEGFSDAAPTKPTLRPTSTTPKDDSSSSSDEVTTTTEKYTISRYELGRILGRNFRGLQRLMRIELQDAFNQTKYNLREYQAEARKQFTNSLAIERRNQLRKQMKG